MSIKTSEIPRCCCTCDRNKRIEDANGMVVRCECEIDGHYIGYLETFEHSCRRYALDKAYKPGGNGMMEKEIVLDEIHECKTMSGFDRISIQKHDGKWFWVFWDDKKGNTAHGIHYCPYCGENLA